MITLIQRVRSAAVLVDGETVGAIERGLLLFVGVEQGDQEADAAETARKVAAMRCFPARTPMDLNVKDAGGAILSVSQFTLAAELRHGNRPDFTAAEAPTRAVDLWQRVGDLLRAGGLTVATGRFGASMQVQICNDGPVTFVLTVRGGRVVARTGPDAPSATS
ncbi:MAG: D-tyrosyl-tRNA(Tyr) deacylase [Planctomycetes bacterium]|nr:D-tyrosyl-tRNA(Tyr) deacylase [Planctomycetota bacterium]